MYIGWLGGHQGGKEIVLTSTYVRPRSHYVWNLAANHQSNDNGRGFGRSCGHTEHVQNGYHSI